MAGKVQESLLGLDIGTWHIDSYLGRSMYSAHCLVCGTSRNIDGYSLKTRGGPKCTECSGKSLKGRIDLTGKTFGRWKVLEYSGNKKWKCQCLDCGTVRDVAGSDLRNGKSTGCGCTTNKKRIALQEGTKIFDWTVIKYNKVYGKYECICSCGATGLLTAYQLTHGLSKSCGHNTTGFKDLTGKMFGNWKVIERGLTIDNRTYWICECQCQNKTRRHVDGYLLRHGITKSCGCLTQKLREQTSLERYGVSHPSQAGTQRTPEQLRAIQSRDNMLEFLKVNFDHVPSAIELADKLGISRCTLKDHLIRFSLFNCITHGQKPISGYERQLQSMFPCKHCSDRTLLEGKEIDLYYPEVNFAIEFNGNYWHSELKKPDVAYHQNKTLEAASKGVQLFHIFEYEWTDKIKRDIISDIIRSKLYGDRVRTIYGRNCSTCLLSNSEAKEFFSTTHIQGYAKSDIAIGLRYNGELVGAMSFGKPRFNQQYQFELIRLSFALSTKIVGGAEKMFKHFITENRPISIISYCNIAKFSGKVYERLGFENKGLTKPNYTWVDVETGDNLTRYQTMKHKLVEAGLGSIDESEDQIMHRLGYSKIYDCGNLKFVWNNPNMEVG